MARNRISRALKSNVPPSASYNIKTGQTVMAFSEKRKKWIKGLKAVLVNRKMILVNDGDKIVKLNRTHVIPQPSDVDKKNISQLL